MVVLMISDKLQDNSQLTVDQAVDYLRNIHVPLLIWAPDEQALEIFGLSQSERSFLGPAGLGDLEEEVGRELQSQTIVWVKGEHLPNELSLSDATPPGREWHCWSRRSSTVPGLRPAGRWAR
jgi:hypothetical protein